MTILDIVSIVLSYRLVEDKENNETENDRENKKNILSCEIAANGT